MHLLDARSDKDIYDNMRLARSVVLSNGKLEAVTLRQVSAKDVPSLTALPTGNRFPIPRGVKDGIYTIRDDSNPVGHLTIEHRGEIAGIQDFGVAAGSERVAVQSIRGAIDMARRGKAVRVRAVFEPRYEPFFAEAGFKTAKDQLLMFAELAKYPEGMPLLNYRNPSQHDSRMFAELKHDAYKGNIDYANETVEDYEESFRRLKAGSAGDFIQEVSYFAVASDKLVSACLVALWDAERVPMLVEFCTHHMYRSRGFGTMLLERSINKLLELGHKRMGVWVSAGNEPAESIFRKRGFREDFRLHVAHLDLTS